MDYRYGSHTVYAIEYHFAWVTKCRYKVLKEEVEERVRELVRQTCVNRQSSGLSGTHKSRTEWHVFCILSRGPMGLNTEVRRLVMITISSLSSYNGTDCK